MCRATTCRTCGLASWSGCGQHVEQVLRGVPRAQRCGGHAPQPRISLWARLRGRG